MEYYTVKNKTSTHTTDKAISDEYENYLESKKPGKKGTQYMIV